MTYRSDHDAALARVDALEHENAELQRKLAPPVRSTAKRKSRGRRYLPVAAVAVIAVSAAFGHAHQKANAIEECAKSLALRPALDDLATDPHGRHLPITPIVATTGCRLELNQQLAGVISSEERAALLEWQSAEEHLENEVALIVTYYGSDPYAADHYASARQLWREYDRAYAVREIARQRYSHVVSQ